MSELPIIEIDPEEMARIMGERYREVEPIRASGSGMTTMEYAKEWGVSRATARRRLHLIEDKGLLIRGERWQQKVNGHWYKVPVYRPKDKNE